MTDYSRKFGNRGFGRYGRGNQLQSVPTPEWIMFDDFSAGYVASRDRQGVPQNATPFAVDTYVTDHGEITRFPGVVREEVFGEHSPTQVALHANLDYGVEMVLFDPPFIGIRSRDEIVWENVGLPSYRRPFTWTNFGGTLVFSNGAVGTYARQANTEGVEVLSEAPPAQALVSFAGRLITGNTTISGKYEPLGVRWSAADSNYTNWQGLGSGFELLIDDMSAGDRIVAMRTMGLDQLAVICRRSIWLGRRTGQRDRPVDIRPRVAGIGAVNANTVRTTRRGIIFLSDSGVFLFDGNTVEMISENINADLLPLDRETIDRFSSFYNPYTKQYHLFTPERTWVYDLARQRWFRKSLRVRAGMLFHDQTDPITWAELTGTWEEQEGTWADLRPELLEQYSTMYLGEDSLGVEDEAEMCYFGEPMKPFWEFPLQQGQNPNDLFTFQRVVISYRGGGEIGLRTPDAEGDYTGVAAYELPVTEDIRSRDLPFLVTGQGAGLRLDFGQGVLRVKRISAQVLRRSSRVQGQVLSRNGSTDYGRAV